MPNHAYATIIGHAGRDAETRCLSNGDPVTKVSVAVTRRVKEQDRTTWWNVVVFGKPADWAGSIAKGDVVFAAGVPELEEWTGSDGTKRQTLKLIASQIVGFGRWQKSAARDGHPAAAIASEPTHDDDIPF